MLQAHSRPGFDALAPNRGRTPTVAYLLAASHSGSTLLAMLLASHPDVCTTGELKATSLGDPEQYRCACGAPIRKCEFWNGIAEAMRSRGHAFDVTKAQAHITTDASGYEQRLLRPLVRSRSLEALRDAALQLSPSWRKRLQTFQSINESLVRSMCDRTGARIVVDSSKVGIRLKYLLRTPGLDVRIVRLVRDGRAVALTYTDPARFADASAAHLRAGGTGGNHDKDRLSIRDAAHEWRRSNEEAEALLGGVDPLRQLTISYEGLCANPQAVISRVWTFLGVEPVRLTPGWRARNPHVIGNGMRFDTTEEVRLDERWKTVLSAEDLALFDKEAGALNRRLGYE